jgi:hypothetical protein
MENLVAYADIVGTVTGILVLSSFIPQLMVVHVLELYGEMDKLLIYDPTKQLKSEIKSNMSFNNIYRWL